MKDFTDLCHDDSIAENLLVIINDEIEKFESRSLKMDITIAEIDKLIDNAA